MHSMRPLTTLVLAIMHTKAQVAISVIKNWVTIYIAGHEELLLGLLH